jgi:hypothetical protein
MNLSVPHLSLLNLLFALLRRWFALWSVGAPPKPFVRVLERTERDLADAIRATLTEDGVAFPALDDPAFLKWFAATFRSADHNARRVRAVGGPARVDVETVNPSGLAPRLPAGQADTDLKPAIHQARAPP